ncbi:hypothetical protein SprV_0501933400 [Sparganum proliferum]
MDVQRATDFLKQKDSILENPGILEEAIQTLQNASSDEGVEQPADLLIDNYQGAIEFLFEIGTWLTYAEDDAQSTRNIIESVVMETILQNYDRNKAIKCLTEDAVSDTMEWLSQMIESPTWRQTIYELAQQPRNEDCPFLSLAMPCIAVNENLIGELISVPLAWNTLEIFLKCATYTLQPLLMAGEIIDDDYFLHDVAFLQPTRGVDSSKHSDGTCTELILNQGVSAGTTSGGQPEKKIQQMLRYFLDMGCHSEHTYLVIQAILQCLFRRTKNNAARRLSWLLESEACRRHRDVSRYSVYFCYSRDFPEEVKATRAILREQRLVSHHVDALYEAFKSESPPPVNLLRQPLLVVMLADALFASSERLLVEQQETYAYLYAYAAVTLEEVDPDTERRISSDRSRVAEACKEVLEASRICRHWNNMTGSGVSLRSFRDLPTLLQCLTCRAAAFGVFRFLWVIFRSKRVDFELNLDTMKPYCIVVNELSTVNAYLRPAILAFVTDLLGSAVEGMEDLSQLEYKRMLVGLLMHLVVCGYVLPTIQTMHSLLERNRVDVSIARYFVTELLHIAAPPYDPLFLTAIHPLVSHPHIFDGLRTDRNTDIVNEFLACYEKQMNSMQVD